MKATELVDKLFPKTDVDIDLHNSMDKDDVVQIEMPDETYVDIKEILYLTDPDRIIIRLADIPDRFPDRMAHLVRLKA